MKRINNKGFSLVELLATMAILAILMTMAATAYNSYKKKARQQAYDTMAKSVTQAATNYLMENSKSKYITFESLKDGEYVDTFQDPRYKEKNCTGIVIQKVVPGDSLKKLDVLFQKVKLCCKNYKYQYDYTGDEVKVTKIDNCNYIEGDEFDGMYKLIYKPLGGTDCDPAIVLKKQNEKWGPLCETSKSNAVFKGWNTKKNGSGETITADTIVGDKDITVYAIWDVNYTLTYDEDGGTTCNPKTITKTSGSKWGTLCEPTKSGYVFSGWRTEKNGGGTKITSNSYAERNLTVYAHWSVYHTLTYDSNGGSACSPNSISKESGQKWGTLCLPIKSGYNFKGWNTKKDGTGVTVNENSIANSNLTVYAQWGQSFTLTYDSNGGSTCNPNKVTKDVGQKWGTLCTPTKSGATFNGWNTKKDGTGTTVNGNSVANSNLTVYAQWIYYYTLTYDSNGGSTCNPGSVTKTGGSVWGTLCSPTKSNYVFGGWNTKKDGSGFFVTQNTTASSNLTVYAIWSENTYTVKYNCNGGTGSTATSTHIYGVYGTLSPNGCSKNNALFLGWADTANGSKKYDNQQSVLNLTTGGTEKMLYAVWQTGSIPSFTYTGKFEIVQDNDTLIASGTNQTYYSSSSYTGNWKIRFLSSGTFTILELNGAKNGIDVFAVGGGGNGGGTYASQAGRYGYSSGGGGGGGGYNTVKRGLSVSLTSYSISIGAARTKSTGFGVTANPGTNGASQVQFDVYVSGGSGSGAGGRGMYNGKTGEAGGAGVCEFNDCNFSSRRYGGGGGSGHGHNGGASSIGTAGPASAGGGGTGNNQYRGYNTHNGTANTGGGGGGASFVFQLSDACYGVSDSRCDCWSSNGCYEVWGYEYAAGKGGSGIVIIRNKR